MSKIRKFINYPLLALKGTLVGIGAIVPGISGGALCAAFGMYEHILNLLAHPIRTIKKHGFELLAFVIGVGIGFVGLAGVTHWLIERYEFMTYCVIIGFVIGTIPELWQDAGKKGRKPSSFVGMGIGFVFLVTLTVVLKMLGTSVMLSPSIPAFLLCGVLWGFSLIVPGLSSSTLIIFFGLYDAMSEGISALDLKVIIPLALGIGICVLSFAKLMSFAMNKWHSQISHTILGFVAATVVSVILVDTENGAFKAALGEGVPTILIGILLMLVGAAFSFFAGVLCKKLDTREDDEDDTAE